MLLDDNPGDISDLQEMVLLTREPTNAYDRFAIRVDNAAHQQVTTKAVLLASLPCHKKMRPSFE